MHHERTATARRWTIRALVALLATLSLALAQRPLAELAPPNALFTLSMSEQQQGFGSLGEALHDLDWAQLMALFERSAAMIDDRDVQEMLEMLRNFDRLGGGMDELDASCEGLSGPLESLMGGSFLDDGLLTVTLSQFNPIPAISAFVRVDAAAVASAATVQSALARCFGDDTFEEAGTTIYLLEDGSDLPLLLTSADDVFMASTSPDVLRAALRLANGNAEPSLADTALWQASARLAPGGLGFSLDLAALADTLQNLAGFMIDDPASEYAANRALAALRTTGGYAGRIGLNDEGILFEALIAVDPDGGDDELAELMLCRACTVSRPFLAPAEVFGVDSQYLPVRELFAYLQSWLDDLGPLVGEDLDIKRLLLDELGFDVDAALLDWIGNQIHTVQLEPFSANVRSLIYNPQVAYIIPVASVEQAQAGLAMMAEAFEPIATEMLRTMNGMGALGDLTATPAFGGGLAVRESSYRGVDITRIQMGFNFDLGIAFIGNNLVLGSPAAAIEPLVDTFEGAPNMLSNSAYSAVTDAAPSSLRSLSYHDFGSSLEGLHELVDALVQPLAGLINTGITTLSGELFGGGFDNFDGFDGGFADLFGLPFTPLALGEGSTSVGGDLSADDEDNYGDYADYFQLLGLEAGDSVTLVVTSSSFDTYLYLIDADAELILDSDDDTPDTSRSELSFVVEPGVEYWVEVASYGGNEIGAYELAVAVERFGGGAAPVAVGPPSYGEILEALELFPEAVAILAAHVESGEGYARVEGSNLYMRQLIRIRW